MSLIIILILLVTILALRKLFKAIRENDERIDKEFTRLDNLNNNNMKTYNNDEQFKKDFVKEVKRHQDMDMVIKGSYGDEPVGGKFRGCAVGCSIHSLNNIKSKSIETNDHKTYAHELGIPEWLARLEDSLFEGMPEADAMMWTEIFAEAIPVGVDLEPVRYKFSEYLMQENIDIVTKLDIYDDLKSQVLKAITGVKDLHTEAIRTGIWDSVAARSAEQSAESAAESVCSEEWLLVQSKQSAEQSAEWSVRAAARSARSQIEPVVRSIVEVAWSARVVQLPVQSSIQESAYLKYSKALITFIKETK